MLYQSFQPLSKVNKIKLAMKLFEVYLELKLLKLWLELYNF